MRSVLASLGDEEVPRLRLGIGPAPPQEDLADWVLADFDPKALTDLPGFVDEAADCVEEIVRSGVQVAMNRFNPSPPAG
jgi:PTH1 family peptidyl-tRNA hydrolase